MGEIPKWKDVQGVPWFSIFVIIFVTLLLGFVSIGLYVMLSPKGMRIMINKDGIDFWGETVYSWDELSYVYVGEEEEMEEKSLLMQLFTAVVRLILLRKFRIGWRNDEKYLHVVSLKGQETLHEQYYLQRHFYNEDDIHRTVLYWSRSKVGDNLDLVLQEYVDKGLLDTSISQKEADGLRGRMHACCQRLMKLHTSLMPITCFAFLFALLFAFLYFTPVFSWKGMWDFATNAFLAHPWRVQGVFFVGLVFAALVHRGIETIWAKRIRHHRSMADLAPEHFAACLVVLSNKDKRYFSKVCIALPLWVIIAGVLVIFVDVIMEG